MFQGRGKDVPPGGKAGQCLLQLRGGGGSGSSHQQAGGQVSIVYHADILKLVFA